MNDALDASPPTRALPRWGIPAVIAILFSWMAGGVLASGVAVSVFGSDASQNAWTYSIIFVGQTLAGFIAVFAVSLLRGRGSLIRDFGFYGYPVDAVWIAAGIGLQFLGLIIVGVILDLVGSDGGEQQTITVLKNAGPGPKISLAICVGVLAPMIEEIIFRGALQRALQRHMIVPLAVLIQAVVFASIHLLDLGALNGLPSIFAVGLLAGFLTARTSRLGPAIALHAGFNLTTVVLLMIFA